MSYTTVLSETQDIFWRRNSPCQQDEYLLAAKYEHGVHQDHIPTVFEKHIYCESANEKKWNITTCMAEA